MDRHRPSHPLMTLDEYLAFEERSAVKHEYVAGEVYALSGVTTRHNLITLNIAMHLRAAARARGCAVFATDVKLKVADRIYYPDLMLVCGRAATAELIIEAPSLIVEVTSPGTRATDRREKLEAYRRIPSLNAYLIVDQRRQHVLAYHRDGAGWSKQELQAGDAVTLPALGARLALDDLYEGVTLPPMTVQEEEWTDDGEEA
jgi:Uma2 family endonuclease